MRLWERIHETLGEDLQRFMRIHKTLEEDLQGFLFYSKTLSMNFNMHAFCDFIPYLSDILAINLLLLISRIPFRQSCCKKCQNFENVINEAAKYLHGVPQDIGNVTDRTMCAYTGYFPKLACKLCTCDNCAEAKYRNKLLDVNRNKLSDKRKHFMVKLWITKTERKEGKVQSFLDWEFERCGYEDLINLLTNHVKSMAEHSFMASWNY